MTALRILIFAPTTLPSITGNAMTVERWRRSLTAVGHKVKVLPSLHIGRQNLAQEIRTYQPHIIHAHHIIKAGAVLQETLQREMDRDIPFVVSPAGTDINGFRTPGEIPELFLNVCRSAKKILVQSPWMLECLRLLLPQT